ncbi:formylmethanofuran dehydrogenase subunit B [Methanococcoides sp. LMO-2]|uniref:Formylmethanofuran dehydrogenase subunit B n=1 Tax=Methanococcoides cohabitans TaxID=3136559 RepID=A0ABU9KSL6_9EURY
MEQEYYVCTGCALLCDDIEIEVNEGKISKVNNACLKGVARLKECEKPAECRVDGNNVSMDEAIKEAAGILKNAEKPLIFGMGNSTTGAQKKAIGIAKKLNAYIDDTSSFCQGPVIEAILGDRIKTCTLEEVKDYGDVTVYWGADPSNSHPRHLSKYTYFPRGKERQRGWEEDRTAICIDVRKSDTAIICADKFYQIPPQADEELIDALIAALSGKVPKVSFGMGPKKILELANMLKKAKFGTICVGLGLIYSLPDVEPLVRLMEKLNEVSNFHLIPMVGQFNMRGFDHNLHDETGYINRAKFGENGVEHGPQCSVVELLRTKSVDAALVIGSDPMSSLPGCIAKELSGIPVVTIDPCVTMTSAKAKVSIASATTGSDSGGTAIRMDGVEIDIEPMITTDSLSDEEILNRIMEAL